MLAALVPDILLAGRVPAPFDHALAVLVLAVALVALPLATAAGVGRFYRCHRDALGWE